MIWTRAIGATAVAGAGAAIGAVIGAYLCGPKGMGVLGFDQDQIEIQHEERINAVMELEALDWRWKQHIDALKWQKLKPLSGDYDNYSTPEIAKSSTSYSKVNQSMAFSIAQLASEHRIDFHDLEMSPKEMAETIQKWKFERSLNLKKISHHPFQTIPDWIKSVKFRMLYRMFRHPF